MQHGAEMLKSSCSWLSDHRRSTNKSYLYSYVHALRYMQAPPELTSAEDSVPEDGDKIHATKGVSEVPT